MAFFSDAPYVGGAERYLHLLAANLDGGRYRPVALICGEGGESEMDSLMRGTGIDTHHVDWPGVISPSGARALGAVLKEISPDIFHMNLPGPFDCRYSLAAPVAKMSCGAAVVSTEHLPMIPTFLKARMLRGFAGRFVDRVITVSEDNARHLSVVHHVPESRIRVIYNGVPDPGAAAAERIFPETKESGGMTLVAVGSLEERKGHGVLIRAMEMLPDDVFLALVGDGPLRTALETDVKKLGLAQRVVFTGRRKDVIPLMKGSDLLVLPSYLEATPYVIMEAFSAGLPVVASAVYGIPELVRDGVTGRLAPAGDPVSLCSAIKAFYDDRRLLERSSQACRAEYESRFTLERSVRETMDLYDGLLRRGTGGGGA